MLLYDLIHINLCGVCLCACVHESMRVFMSENVCVYALAFGRERMNDTVCIHMNVQMR